MITAVAFVPAPPILAPDVATGAAAELDGVRAACAAAIGAVLATRPDRVVLVGVADSTYADDDGPVGVPAPALAPAGAVGSLRPLGVAVDVPLDPAAALAGGDAPAALPLAHTVGAWLLARTGWPGPRDALVLPPDASPEAARAAGADLAATSDRLALVVLGEGSACRTEKAPGYVDPAAEPYDAALASALGAADADALAALEPDAARRLLVSGRVPWQVAAGAVADAGAGSGAPAGAGSGAAPPAGRWFGALLAAEAPYGVGYLVATWLPAAS